MRGAHVGARGLAVLALWLAACTAGGDRGSDAGTDAGARDAAADARAAADADADAAPDAAPDAGARDGGPDLGPSAWFVDVTSAAGITFARTPADGWTTLPDVMSGGVCPIDVDGRPPIDLFFAMRPSGGVGSRLYVGRGPLDYVDQTATRGLDALFDAHGCLAYDEDGDGDDDLVVTGLGTVKLFHNVAGHFVDDSAMLGVTLDPRDFYASAAAGDVDHDGDLDLLVAGFIHYDPSRFALGAACTASIPCPMDLLSYPGIPSLLLARGADGRYADVAATVAPDLVRADPTLVLRVTRMSGEGPVQIYVGNDLGSYFHDYVLDEPAGSAAYTDRSIDFGVTTDSRGYGIDTMGFSAGDFDENGTLDYVESSFYGQPTALFLCDPATLFCEDRSTRAGLLPLTVSFRWGEAAADFDLDGHVDFAEAAGELYDDPLAARLGMSARREEPMNLARGRGDGTFELVAPPATDGLAAHRALRGLALTDLDDDGRPDLVAAPAVGAPVLLRNVHPPVGHFLRVTVLGHGAMRDAAGARVRVVQGARTVVKDRAIGEGYLGNFDRRLFFGLADASPVEVRVAWPDGTTSGTSGVTVDGDLVLTEP